MCIRDRYASIGRGYGYSGQGLTSADRSNWYGSNNGNLNMTFRKADGTFAYDEIYALNEASENGSVMAMSKSKNFHNWYGDVYKRQDCEFLTQTAEAMVGIAFIQIVLKRFF